MPQAFFRAECPFFHDIYQVKRGDFVGLQDLFLQSGYAYGSERAK